MSYCNLHCWLSFPLHWIPTLSASQKSQKCTKDCGTVVKAAAQRLQHWLTSCSTGFAPEGYQLHLNSSALGKSDRYKILGLVNYYSSRRVFPSLSTLHATLRLSSMRFWWWKANFGESCSLMFITSFSAPQQRLFCHW